MELDFVAEGAAHVAAEFVVGAFDGELGGDASFLALFAEVFGAEELEGDVEFVGGASCGEGACGDVLLAVFEGDFGGVEGPVAVVVGVEEVGAAEVVVAVLDASVYAFGIEGGLDGAFLRIFFVPNQCDIKGLEGAYKWSEDVADGKQHGAVGGVGGPSGRLGVGHAAESTADQEQKGEAENTGLHRAIDWECYKFIL